MVHHRVPARQADSHHDRSETRQSGRCWGRTILEPRWKVSLDTLMVGRMLRLRISKCDLMERLCIITHLHKPTDPTTLLSATRDEIR